MANQIAAQGVHHFRLTVSNVDRAVKFYTEVLGFTKLMDLNPGAFLSNGSVGLGIGPHPFPDRAIKNDRFDENRIGLDHMSFAVRRGPRPRQARGRAQRDPRSRRGVRDLHRRVSRSRQRAAGGQRAPEVASSAILRTSTSTPVS